MAARPCPSPCRPPCPAWLPSGSDEDLTGLVPGTLAALLARLGATACVRVQGHSVRGGHRPTVPRALAVYTGWPVHVWGRVQKWVLPSRGSARALPVGRKHTLRARDPASRLDRRPFPADNLRPAPDAGLRCHSPGSRGTRRGDLGCSLGATLSAGPCVLCTLSPLWCSQLARGTWEPAHCV